jgi:diadenosine tetraphosphate (Ap4A) HIT family hydrolase
MTLYSQTATAFNGSNCPFCSLKNERVIEENELAMAIRDHRPVRPGHTLVIPKRHVQSFWDASNEEILAMFDLLKIVKTGLEKEFGADGFNIGINIGPAAGQTVMHLHIHCIPRKSGDVKDPRGGIRKLGRERNSHIGREYHID